MSEDIFIGDTAPPVGTNWSVRAIQDLKLSSRNMRKVRKTVLFRAQFLKNMGFILGILTLLIAAVNVFLELVLLSIFIVILNAILIYVSFGDFAQKCYDTAFEMNDIIDSIHCELMLPVCERLDAVYYLRVIQIDRDAILEDFELTTLQV